MRMLIFGVIMTAISSAQTPATSASAPPAVKAAFEKAYPGVSISGIAPEQEGNRPAFRVAGLHDGKRRSVLYDAAGAAIEVAESVEEKELPPPVAAAMRSHPRAVYVGGLKVTRGAAVEYRLTVRGTRKTAMVAKADGTVVSFE